MKKRKREKKIKCKQHGHQFAIVMWCCLFKFLGHIFYVVLIIVGVLKFKNPQMYIICIGLGEKVLSNEGQIQILKQT